MRGHGGVQQRPVRQVALDEYGIRVDGVLEPDFPRDMAAWVQSLPGSANEVPKVAGAEPYQRFVASPVDRPRWFAEGDLFVALLVTVGLSLLVGPVVWGTRRILGRRTRMLANGVRLPLTVMTLSGLASFVGFVVYLLVVANLAQHYRTNALVVQGGWLTVRMLGVVSVVAGVILTFRVLDGRRRRGIRAARNRAGAAVLSGSVTGSVLLLSLLSYWNVFPPLHL